MCFYWIAHRPQDLGCLLLPFETLYSPELDEYSFQLEKKSLKSPFLPIFISSLSFEFSLCHFWLLFQLVVWHCICFCPCLWSVYTQTQSYRSQSYPSPFYVGRTLYFAPSFLIYIPLKSNRASFGFMAIKENILVAQIIQKIGILDKLKSHAVLLSAKSSTKA